MEVKRITPPGKSSKFCLGKLCDLELLRLVSIGAYLEWEHEDGILLPQRYLPSDAKVGDILRVFVYHDNEGRLIATTLIPYAQVGEVALLECVSTSQAGAFMAWGIHKDLFVPFAEQQGRLQEGKHYLVYLYIDHLSGKIVGSAKLSKHIGNTLPTLKVGDEVSIVITEPNDVGYRAVVEGKYWGILYYNTTPQPLQRGDKRQAFVARLRDDARLDLSLRPIGYERTEGDATKILRLLRQKGGRLALGDKSPSEEVMRLTGLSKKSFKMAIGKLYKEKYINLSPTSITLIR